MTRAIRLAMLQAAILGMGAGMAAVPRPKDEDEAMALTDLPPEQRPIKFIKPPGFKEISLREFPRSMRTPRPPCLTPKAQAKGYKPR